MHGAAMPLALAVIAGALMALQAPTNALLSKSAGSPVTAAFISFLVGSAVLALLVAIGPSRPSASDLKGLPWYGWIGGFYGAFFVAVAAFAAPRLGVGSLLTAVVAGQLSAALILDHYGLLGLDKHPASMSRLAGLALVLVGAVLVRRS